VLGGESIVDVVMRLQPFVIELERQRRPVLVVSHLSTLQVLLAYFKGVPLAECVDLPFPCRPWWN
jgi:broad specificity phosphatase PhoE